MFQNALVNTRNKIWWYTVQYFVVNLQQIAENKESLVKSYSVRQQNVKTQWLKFERY